MDSTKYTVILAIPDMDDTTVSAADKLFFGYKEKCVITSGNFSDDCWYVTDEYANYTLNYSLLESDFREMGAFLRMSAEEFVLYLKTYVVCHMGLLSLGTLQHIVYIAKVLATCPVDNMAAVIATHNESFLGRVAEFFSLLPSAGREQALEQLSECFDDAEDIVCSRDGQRTLATFESYFRFDEIIKQFWNEAEDVSEKVTIILLQIIRKSKGGGIMKRIRQIFQRNLHYFLRIERISRVQTAVRKRIAE